MPFLAQQDQQGLRGQMLKTNTARVAQPFRVGTNYVSEGDSHYQACFQIVTQGADSGMRIGRQPRGSFRSHPEADNRWDVLSSGSQATFLVPADQRRRQARVLANVQSPHTLGAM